VVGFFARRRPTGGRHDLVRRYHFGLLCTTVIGVLYRKLGPVFGNRNDLANLVDVENRYADLLRILNRS